MKSWRRILRLAAACAGVCAASMATPARGEVDVSWGGRVQSDLRLRPESKGLGGWYARQDLPVGVSRNTNLFKLRVNGTSSRVAAVVDLDFLWWGITDQIHGLADLTYRQNIDPYRFKAHALYIDIRDLFTPGLDVRIGQQLVNWGKGDQFNPTNNLNGNDFEDPLLFGIQLANVIVRADYALDDTWTLSGALVPVFRPALLPQSAPIALADTSRLPFTQESVRDLIYAAQGVPLFNGYPTVVNNTVVTLPSQSIENMQFSLRFAGSLFNHDVALSYYNGHSDIPQPYSNRSVAVNEPLCNPLNQTQCIAGFVQTTTEVRYPRMQVLGINIAGEFPIFEWFGSDKPPFGYHLEFAYIIPNQQSMRIYNAPMAFQFGPPQAGGEFDYNLPAGQYPTVVDGKSFAKWNLGLDYTLPGSTYLNVQWIHGFVDDFGVGESAARGWTTDTMDPVTCLATNGVACTTEIVRPKVGDYLVFGVDAHFLGDTVLARLFIIYDLSGLTTISWDPEREERVRTQHSPFSAEAMSAVIFPELTYNAGDGVDISVGALAKLGHTWTKFGDPAAGGTDLWMRGRYTF